MENLTISEPTVFVVDDDPALCNAVQWLLQSINLNVEIFYNGQTYLDTYDPKRYGCLLLDIRMPIMSGFELLDRLNKLGNRLPIIFITGHGDVPMAVRAMQEGAIDFVLKPFNDQILLEKIQKAIEADKQRKEHFQDPEIQQRLSKLTARELEVMNFIVDGKLSKQIAFALKISESTVDFHRSNLMRKLQVKSIADLVKIHLLNNVSLALIK
jgi:two-component system response regulator FixJ